MSVHGGNVACFLNPAFNLVHLTSFFISAGQYCEGDANDVPTADCAPGWYCTRGAYQYKPIAYVNASINASDYSVAECPVYSLNDTGAICPPGKESQS